MKWAKHSEQVLKINIGSFGRVKVALCKSTKKHHAIKILKKSEIIKLKQVDHIQNEVKILSAIDHPFMVKTEGFSQDERYLYLVLELINGGEMFTYLRSVGKFPVDQSW
jgi:serine/threonine protein kinase